MAERLTAQGLFLFATNTGELYDTHKLMARQEAPIEAWRMHIATRVLPRYRREFHTDVLTSHQVRTEAARQLKDYYERHIREG